MPLPLRRPAVAGVALPVRLAPLAAALAALAAALAGAAPAPLGAQAVLGIGDDALVLPKGVFRLRVIGQRVGFDERFGAISTSGRAPNGREPIVQDLNIPSIGILQFPNLTPVQNGLRALTADPTYALDLGRTTATSDVRVNAASLVTELGLTRRLSLGVVVPFVDTRHDVRLRANPNGEGNVGFNPASIGGLAAARQQNTQLVGTLLGAARGVEQALGLPAGGCAGQASQPCQLVLGARAFAGGVGQIYGADPIPAIGYAGAAGSPFVPLGASAAQTAIVTRAVGLLRLLTQNPGATLAGPFGAPANLSLANAQTILTQGAFGVGAEPVAPVTRRGLGDLEVAAKYSLYNDFGFDDPNARLTPGQGLKLRTALTGVVRVGSGLAENPRNFVDVPTGTGAHALGLRSTTDVVAGARFFGSLGLRYTAQLPDDQVVRIIDQPERVLAASYREQKVRRDLGDFFEIEATPRLVLTDWLLVAGQWSYRYKDRDQYRGRFTIPGATTGFGDLTLDARTLSAETEAREHRLGGGVSLSSVKAFARGRAPLPGELTYTVQRSVMGYGGAVPVVTLHQLQLRLYARVFGD